MQILSTLLAAIPQLIKQCNKLRPGPQEDCAGKETFGIVFSCNLGDLEVEV